LSLLLSSHMQHTHETNYFHTLSRPAFPSNEEPEKKKDEQERAENVWAAEGKELLRKRLIGQKVRLVFDYVRRPPKREGEKEAPEKACYSVYQNYQNLAVILVELGLAWAQPPRQGEERSTDFEVLLIAENKAKQAHRGVHMPLDKVPVRRINDLCVDSDSKNRSTQITRAKQSLPGFQRKGQMRAIVEYVFSGARFKLFIPKETSTFMFTLSGLRVPKREENDELSNQALQFSREKLHQVEVNIEVDDVDKGGNFVGSLYTSSKKNFAVFLLEAGLSYVHAPSAERLKDGKDLLAAEIAAKKKKRWA